jgi:hypothetical protein
VDIGFGKFEKRGQHRVELIPGQVIHLIRKPTDLVVGSLLSTAVCNQH